MSKAVLVALAPVGAGISALGAGPARTSHVVNVPDGVAGVAGGYG